MISRNDGIKPPDCFVLDSLANDVESIEDILRMINSATALGWTEEWGREFARVEVVAALARLIRGGHVQAYSPVDDDALLTPLDERSLPANFELAYYEMTELGRVAHATWADGGQSEQHRVVGEC